MLTEWNRDISTAYRIGDTEVTEGTTEMTALILNRFQAATIKDMLGIDFREYKQTDEEVLEIVLRNISKSISDAQYVHNTASVRSILRTASDWIRRVTGLAIANGWTQREATGSLSNYLRGQSLIIGTTESQWVIEAVRKTAVVMINDPLKNSVRRIADLFRQGLTTEARKLGREVMKLAKLPLSEGQGTIIRLVSESQSRLITPANQARVIANMESRAEELGKNEKEWNAIFVRTRETHAEADGQIQNVDSPYIVGGEMMQHPGDGTLGASLWNIVNCQCYSYYL